MKLSSYFLLASALLFLNSCGNPSAQVEQAMAGIRTAEHNMPGSLEGKWTGPCRKAQKGSGRSTYEFFTAFHQTFLWNWYQPYSDENCKVSDGNAFTFGRNTYKLSGPSIAVKDGWNIDVTSNGTVFYGTLLQKNNILQLVYGSENPEKRTTDMTLSSEYVK